MAILTQLNLVPITLKLCTDTCTQIPVFYECSLLLGFKQHNVLIKHQGIRRMYLLKKSPFISKSGLILRCKHINVTIIGSYPDIQNITLTVIDS